MLNVRSELTRLVAQENFVTFSRHEIFKSYEETLPLSLPSQDRAILGRIRT